MIEVEKNSESRSMQSSSAASSAFADELFGSMNNRNESRSVGKVEKHDSDAAPKQPAEAKGDNETYDMTYGSPAYWSLMRRSGNSTENDQKDYESQKPGETDKSRETYEMTEGSPAHRALMRRMAQPDENRQSRQAEDKTLNTYRDRFGGSALPGLVIEGM